MLQPLHQDMDHRKGVLILESDLVESFVVEAHSTNPSFFGTKISGEPHGCGTWFYNFSILVKYLTCYNHSTKTWTIGKGY
jgi:hypothetical protein